MSEKVLIVGGKSFLGQKLRQLLVAAGRDVLITSRSQPRPTNEAEVFWDVGSYRTRTPEVKGVTQLVLLATPTAPAGVTPAQMLQASSNIGTNFLNLARQLSDLQTVIMASSLSVYGTRNGFQPITANSGTIDPTPYGAAKLGLETVLRSELRRIDLFMPRFGALLGQGARTGWVVRVASALAQNQPVNIYASDQRFNHVIGVSQAAELMVALLERSPEKSRGPLAAPVASVPDMKVGQVVDILKAHFKSSSRVVLEEVSDGLGVADWNCWREFGQPPQKTSEVVQDYLRSIQLN